MVQALFQAESDLDSEVVRGVPVTVPKQCPEAACPDAAAAVVVGTAGLG
jgi:hypothetical protein